MKYGFASEKAEEVVVEEKEGEKTNQSSSVWWSDTPTWKVIRRGRQLGLSIV